MRPEINEPPAKKFSIMFMAIFIAVALVTLIIWSLFSFWRTNPVPVAYVIQDVIPNVEHLTDECDTPEITVLKNAVTETIVYKCGNLGKSREVVTFYE